MPRNAPHAHIKRRQRLVVTADYNMPVAGGHGLPRSRSVRQARPEILINRFFQKNCLMADAEPVFHRTFGHGMDVTDAEVQSFPRRTGKEHKTISVFQHQVAVPSGRFIQRIRPRRPCPKQRAEAQQNCRHVQKKFRHVHSARRPRRAEALPQSGRHRLQHFALEIALKRNRARESPSPQGFTSTRLFP